MPYKKNTSVKARIARVERRLRQTAPELKYAQGAFHTNIADGTIQYLDMSEIAQGIGQSNRIGNEIRIHSIEVRCRTENGYVDLYILKTNGGISPTYSDFDSYHGGSLKHQVAQEFSLIAHRSWTVGLNIVHYKRFKNPIKTTYTGGLTTDGADNRLFVVVKNNSAVAQFTTLYARIRYYDT